VRHPRRTAMRLRLRAAMARLRLVNRFSRRPAVGDADAVVSVTSFGHRLSTVFAALETIARGSVRPRRLILWVSDPDFLAAPPKEIVRLQRRGLEILACPDYGPHKKQFPYASAGAPHTLPLVIGDDDVFYPRGWLAGLVAAARAEPALVHGYRAHRITLTGDALAPYAQWLPAPDLSPSYAVVCTGVGGIIYPPALLDALAAEGEGFLAVAPRADDVWVHAVSVRAGIRTQQIPSRRRDLDAIPGTQRGTLQSVNVKAGGNDAQIAAAYGPAEIAAIVADARALTAS